MKTTPLLSFLPLLAVALLLNRCSSSGDASPPAAASPAGDAGDSSTSQLACADDGVTDLGGTWAALARFSLRLTSQSGGVAMVCPEVQVAGADMLFMIRIEGAGATPQLTAWPCSLTLPSVTALVGDCHPDASNLLSTEIILPDALLSSFAAIPVETVPGVVQGAGPDAPFSFSRFHFTWGTRGSDSPLPSWRTDQPGCGLSDFGPGHSQLCEQDCVDDCGALVDDDGDGYPAVTLHVCGRLPHDVASSVACLPQTPNVPGTTLQGLLPMVLHSELELEGTARSSCEASAKFDSKTVYSVVGADAYLANTKISVASAIKSLPLFDAVKADSAFRMIRVDGRFGTADWKLDAASPTVSCAEVLKRRNELQ